MKNIPILAIVTLINALTPNLIWAQATRTWVSGVGDDANPCSRTAPCKTFAGAISKTAASGEINVLDPGGFGAVTITKSITISSIGFEAGILVSGTNGVNINAAATDVVILKGLDFEGLLTSLNGVNILSAKDVLIEDCTFDGFKAAGTGNAINVAPTANPVNVVIHNCRISKCNSAVNVTPLGAVTADVNIIGVLVSLNLVGINSTGTGASVRVSNSSILNNATGVTASTGKVISFGNNNIAGNTNNNAITVLSQQ